MPKKHGLPDLKTRFGWLPGANKVDPQIYTQLDPTAKKPVPDYNAQDPESAQPERITGTIPKIPEKTPPPTGGPGGGPGGGPPYVPPPVVPPPVTPPIIPGQEWEKIPPVVPPPVVPPFPTVTTGPITRPPQPTGGPVNPGQSINPPPPTTPINTGQSWEPPIGWDPTPSHPIGTGMGWELPPPATPPNSGQSWETIPGRGPTGPTTGPSVIQKPGQPVESTSSTFNPYEGSTTGPAVGPPLGGTGWTVPPEVGGGGGGFETGGGGVGVEGSGGFITSPPVTPPTGTGGGRGGTGVSETIDWGSEGGRNFVGGVDFGRQYNFARGGIIMKPRIGRVGERGPEAIMKLGPRMPGGWEEPMRPGKLPYQAMRYSRKGEDV